MFSMIGEFLKPVSAPDGRARTESVSESAGVSGGGGQGGGGYGGTGEQNTKSVESAAVGDDRGDRLVLSLTALAALLNNDDKPLSEVPRPAASFPAENAEDMALLAQQATEAYRQTGAAVSSFSPEGKEIEALEGDIKRRLEMLVTAGRDSLSVIPGESVLSALMRETDLSGAEEEI